MEPGGTNQRHLMLTLLNILAISSISKGLKGEAATFSGFLTGYYQPLGLIILSELDQTHA